MPPLRPTRLNALWRFLAFVALSQMVQAGLQWLLFDRLCVVDAADLSWRPSLFIWLEGASLVAVLAATVLTARLQRRRLAELGFARERALRQLAVGSAFGIAAPGLLVAAIAALGGFSFGSFAMHGVRLVAYTVAWFAAFALVGLAEEALFRGASQFLLAEAVGAWPAVIAISLLFGGLHLFGKGPNETLADGLAVAAFGVFSGFTVLRTGSIWFAVGEHALWDYCALFALGAPNTGNANGQPIATKLLTGGFHGPAWLTGGTNGIEASWLVFPVIAIEFVVFLLITRPRRSVSGAVAPHPQP